MTDFDDLQPDLDPPDMVMPPKSSRAVRVHVRRESDTESTSAALARVTAERASLKLANAALVKLGGQAEQNRKQERLLRLAAERERDEARAKASDAEHSRKVATERLTAERDEALSTVAMRTGQLIASRHFVGEARAERDELKGEVERLVDLGSKKMAERDAALAASMPGGSAMSRQGREEATERALELVKEKAALASLAEGFRRTIADLAEERDGLKTALTLTNTSREFNLSLSSELKARVADLAAERAELTDERDHARSERDALKALYDDLAKRTWIVDAYDAWQCPNSGQRWPDPRRNGHSAFCKEPLMPVRVTITRRTAGEPLEEGKAPHA